MRQFNPRLVLICACTVSIASVAHAHELALEEAIEIPEGSDAYVSSDGMAVRTGDGHCLKMPGFSEETQVNACEGIEEAVAEVEPEPEPEVAPPPPPEPVARVTLREVDERTLFEFDSSDLTDDGEAVLTTLLGELERYDDVTEINVIGHTDSTGTEEYNMGLSERRAATVATLLADAYPDARIDIEGRGEQDPIATNDTPEGRQSNRRVDIEVSAEETTFE